MVHCVYKPFSGTFHYMGRYRGTMLAVGIALVSYLLSQINPVFDPLVTAIIIGIITSSLIEKKNDIERGAERVIKLCLPPGIALYGFQLTFESALPFAQLVWLVVAFILLYAAGLLFSHLFNLDKNTSILLSTGLTVCGASAIAVVSPAIGARRHETSVAVVAVMAAGLVYTFLFPVLWDVLSVPSETAAFITGSTLPMVGQVKVASMAFDDSIALYALHFKYLRVASLVFMVAVAIALSGSQEKKIAIPWFMILFVLFAIAANVVLPAALKAPLSVVSSLLLTTALAAIGLNTSLDAAAELGIKPFFAAFLSFTCAFIVLFLLSRVV